MSDGPFDTSDYQTPDSDSTVAEVYEMNADNVELAAEDLTTSDTSSADLWDASLAADGQSWDAWRAGNEANLNASEALHAGDTEGYYAWNEVENAAGSWESSSTAASADLDTASDTAYAAEGEAESADTTAYDTSGSYDATAYDATAYDATAYDATAYDATADDTSSYDTSTSYDTTADTTSYDSGY